MTGRKRTGTDNGSSARAVGTTVTRTYELECVACQFEEEVEGDVEDALELVEEHESIGEDRVSDHFVNLTLADDD